jgi:hypothetical protein
MKSLYAFLFCLLYGSDNSSYKLNIKQEGGAKRKTFPILAKIQ